jgi:tetratricopeptide (TPR) repeat protein
LALQPRYWSALLNRGQAKAELGDAKGAREDLVAALVENAELADAYYALGRLLEEDLSQPEEARGYYRAFVDKFPRDSRRREVQSKLSRWAAVP